MSLLKQLLRISRRTIVCTRWDNSRQEENFVWQSLWMACTRTRVKNVTCLPLLKMSWNGENSHSFWRGYFLLYESQIFTKFGQNIPETSRNKSFVGDFLFSWIFLLWRGAFNMVVKLFDTVTSRVHKKWPTKIQKNADTLCLLITCTVNPLCSGHLGDRWVTFV